MNNAVSNCGILEMSSFLLLAWQSIGIIELSATQNGGCVPGSGSRNVLGIWYYRVVNGLTPVRDDQVQRLRREGAPMDKIQVGFTTRELYDERGN